VSSGAPHREALVAAGIELYELKPSAYAELAQRGKGAGSGSRSRSWLSSSRASLHAKNYIVDQHLVFIGSLNMDPRSARLNTEMGVVLDNAAVAQRILKSMNDGLLYIAYRLELRQSPDGSSRHLTWVTREQGQMKTYDSEPGMSPQQQLGVGFLRVLPIKEEL
jgi:putative cardiolipin synthase